MPKLLWVSPLSIHDTASASATQMRNMLLSLRARDVDIVALSALNFVNDSGTSMFTDLEEKLKNSKENSFSLNDNQINCIYMRTQSRRLADMISQEQRNLYAKFCGIINSFRPDVVMGTGSDVMSMVCFDEAHRRGLPTAYVLLDGTPRRFNFPNIDVVITDSNAIANLYATQHRINCVVTGSFLPVTSPILQAQAQKEKQKEGAEPVERTRITMINPSVEKGLAIFLQMAKTAIKNKEAKGFKFSVYETYEGQFKQQVALLHKKDSTDAAFEDKDLKYIEVLGPQTPNVEVLESTKLLVVPSLTFEGIVNIAREAIACGIPVLATNQLGLAESVGEAGILVDVPPYCTADPKTVPESTDINGWLKGLNMGLTQDFTERCQNMTKKNDVNISGNRLAIILKPLFDLRAGNNPQLLRNGSLI